MIFSLQLEKACNSEKSFADVWPLSLAQLSPAMIRRHHRSHLDLVQLTLLSAQPRKGMAASQHQCRSPRFTQCCRMTLTVPRRSARVNRHRGGLSCFPLVTDSCSETSTVDARNHYTGRRRSNTKDLEKPAELLLSLAKTGTDKITLTEEDRMGKERQVAWRRNSERCLCLSPVERRRTIIWTKTNSASRLSLTTEDHSCLSNHWQRLLLRRMDRELFI
jgi:hypothetical protein